MKEYDTLLTAPCTQAPSEAPCTQAPCTQGPSEPPAHRAPLYVQTDYIVVNGVHCFSKKAALKQLKTFLSVFPFREIGIMDQCKMHGISYQTLCYRMRVKKMTFDEALNWKKTKKDYKTDNRRRARLKAGYTEEQANLSVEDFKHCKRKINLHYVCWVLGLKYNSVYVYLKRHPQKDIEEYLNEISNGNYSVEFRAGDEYGSFIRRVSDDS